MFSHKSVLRTTGYGSNNRYKITDVERGEAVPAEDVFTPFAHHLSAALVFLYRHSTHRTALDEFRVKRDAGNGLSQVLENTL